VQALLRDVVGVLCAVDALEGGVRYAFADARSDEVIAAFRFGFSFSDFDGLRVGDALVFELELDHFINDPFAVLLGSFSATSKPDACQKGE
jgi:hypothetical protein